MNLATKAFIGTVIAADLMAVTYFGGNYILTGHLFAEKEEPKVLVAGAEDTAKPAEQSAPEAAFDPKTYVASAENGAKIAGKCKACHDFTNGGPNRTGPNLWGIVGAPVTHKADFSYSSAMVAEKAKLGTWTEDNLFAFLENPQEHVPGTKMAFPGLKKPQDRLDLIAYLKTLK